MTGKIIICCIILFLPFMVLHPIPRSWLLILLLHLARHRDRECLAAGRSANVKG